MIDTNKTHKIKGTIIKTEQHAMVRWATIHVETDRGVFIGSPVRKRQNMKVGDSVTIEISYSIVAETYVIRGVVVHRKPAPKLSLVICNYDESAGVRVLRNNMSLADRRDRAVGGMK